MIDFNNTNTFPKELRNWGTEFEKMILRRVNTDNIEESWQIEHHSKILNAESKLVTEFIKDNMDTENLQYVIAHIINENEYWMHRLLLRKGKQQCWRNSTKIPMWILV